MLTRLQYNLHKISIQLHNDAAGSMEFHNITGAIYNQLKDKVCLKINAWSGVG